MLYKKEELPQVMQTAGKITILTALAGVLVFAAAFIFDIGTHQLSKVSAQTASTTLTVLNTPPSFVVNAYEITESSTTTPTNSGSVIQWRAVGLDSNNAPYFLLVCSTNASPTANDAIDNFNLGTTPPNCGGGTQWGVSASAPSGSPVTVTATTTEIAPFLEANNWFAWVCDDDPVNPRCNNVPVQGYSATNSSPFHVNKRPVLTNFYNNGPIDPGATLTFLSTSTDPDVVGGEDTIKLVVCQTNTYDSTTNTCSSGFLASTTVGVTANASASYLLASIVRDNSYGAFGFIVDQHGHEASANPISQSFTVNNVAPTVLGGDIDLNGGVDITLTQEADETTGFTLDFIARDANSCVNSVAAPEIVNYRVAVFRSDYGTTTCSGLAGTYNPNYCYPSGVSSAVWNLNCVASSTSCTGPLDDSVIFECTFPLWFIADPTDNAVNIPAAFEAANWSAGVSAIDDDAAIGAMATTSNPVDLISFTALDLLTAEIPFGALEPGDDSGTLTATTTIVSTGNTGIDQELTGESMCGTFAVGNECAPSASSTIPESEQQFASTSIAYDSIFAGTLSSTTNQELELDVNKTTSTSTLSQGVTYWGIAVPISITLAGSYQGLNTFTAVTAEATDW